LVPEFAASVMVTERTKEQFRRGRGGGNISNLSQDILAGVQVALPPLPEQRKIAEILSTWDAAIEKTEALLATAKAQKRALMQSLLTGKRRFPGFEGLPWKEVRLGDVLNGKKTKGKIVETNTDGRGQPYIGATSFEGNFAVFTNDAKAVLCEPTDLLVLWDGENAGATAVGLRGAVSSTVVRFRFDEEKVRASFVAAHMEIRNYQVRAIREGSGIPHMPKDFEQWFKFSLPTIAEQSQIMSAIGGAQAEVRGLVCESNKLRAEKKALMQQLLTGKRRVVV
jgi:type I restriction enzyme S subunit